MQGILRKSIGFLLENAGPVIRYRLRKEILDDISEAEEESLLNEIYELPYFKLVQSYAKPNGYIGNEMHGHSSLRGVVLHETPLHDGENAARLLSYYAIPREHPLVSGFVAAMRDEDTLRHEFSLHPSAVKRFEHRYNAMNNGNSLMGMMYTLQAMLGHGDDTDEVRAYQDICLKGFKRVLKISSLNEITKERNVKANKSNYRYLEADEYFPCIYTVAHLAYTNSWRTPENIGLLARALNHINAVMEPHEGIIGFQVKVYGNYIGPLWALTSPVRPFRADAPGTFRRLLTEIAMLGVGETVGVIRESVENVYNAIDSDGILRMDFNAPHNRYYSPKNIKYPSAYGDVRLEADYKSNKTALLCDLTFWAVQFLTFVEQGGKK
jgi:hypothetical protein